MEKLKGFTCLTEPSVRCRESEGREKKTAGAGNKICDRRSSVPPPCEVTDQPGDKNGLQQPEEENEDEKEEVKEKESSALAATKQVPNINVDTMLHLSQYVLSNMLAQRGRFNAS